MAIDPKEMREQVIAKLFALTKGTPHGLDSEGIVKNRKIKFDALKTLLAYFQKIELQDEPEDDECDLPKTKEGLKARLAKISRELSTDDPEKA